MPVKVKEKCLFLSVRNTISKYCSKVSYWSKYERTGSLFNIFIRAFFYEMSDLTSSKIFYEQAYRKATSLKYN